MAAVALMNSDPTAGSDPATDSGDLSALHRNIEFHIANKQYNGSSNNSNGFKMLTLNPSPDNSEPQKASGSDKKCDVSELADSGLDPELGFRITFRRIGAGLRNLGNTCFLNSVLQCLTYTEPLAAYLQSGKHRNSCRIAGFCALCAIQKHVSHALKSTGRILEPKDLVSNLRCISQNFRIAQQEDAHEYMVNLLESMHKCCLPSGVPCESPSAYEKSLVHKIFGGCLRSQVKCMQCSFCSDKFDPFLDLSLEIMKADSLYKALTHFTAKEQLDGGAKQYQCQQCKQKVEAVRQLTIHDAPHVLTVHLKRFDSYVLGQKIDRKIEFGSTLDLKPFVSGPYDGDLNYTLYGVLVHAGWTTHSGHYYCFVRTSGGMWYSLDDNQVLHVSESRVLKQEAYMLFYVRDRKKSVTEKPVDVLQKENIVKNGLGKEPDSKCNPELKENMQNGSSDMKLDDSISATLTDGNVLNGTTKEETSANVGSFERVTDTVTVECLPLKESTQSEPFPVVAPPNDSVMGTCASNITSMDQLEKSVSQVEVSGDAPALGNVQSEPFSVAPPKHTMGIISAANITSVDHLEESEVKVPRDASTLGNTDSQPFSVIAPSKDTVTLVDHSDAPSLGNTTQTVSLSVITPAKDAVQDISAANINSVNDLEKSVSLVKDTADASNLDHADKIVNCSSGDSAQQDVNAPAAVLPDSKTTQVSLNNNELNDIVSIPNNCSKGSTAEEHQSKTLIEQPNSTVLCISSVDVCNMDGTDSRKWEVKAMSVKTNVEALTKTGFTKTLDKSIIDESLVECSLRKSCDSTAEDTLDVSPKVIHFRSESVCGLPAITESLLPMKVSKDPPLRVKKKAFKRQFAGMQLSSSIIFGVAQQKKNKRRKYLSKLKKNLTSENLLDRNDMPSDLGPSTSEKPLPAASGHSRRKRSNCGSVYKDKVSSALSSTSNCKPRRDINNEVSKRIAPNGTTVATEKQPQKGLGCGSKPKQTAAEGRLILDGQRKSINDMMSMLTRGLESKIARWNDMDIPMSKTTESRGVETVQIGYIGDEWDEEYDRGKRKKVKRSKINFCKPNLFQKFATKQNRKKSKLNRSSSGNQPFRI